MELMLLALISLAGLELLIYTPWGWQYREVMAVILVVLLAIISGGLWNKPLLLGGLLVLSVGLYRLFNLLRLASGTVEPKRLRRVTRRSSWWLIEAQAVMIGLAWLLHYYTVTGWTILTVVALVQAIVALVLLTSTRRQLKKTYAEPALTTYTDRELPSITVCIPARNETDTLAECLRSVVASDYPKLEILAVDDCSQDKTSEVIKSFAHAGVRFLHGSVPPEAWLAKNWAYQQLYEAANGEYLVFLGVDIRLEPQSLRALVTATLDRKKSMVCLIPQNVTPPALKVNYSTLLQPMRYAWQLALPRRTLNRPPTLSSCWLVERKLLRHGGSFAAVSHSIAPEQVIARLAIKQDGYSFLQASGAIAVTSQKSLAEQLGTAVRTRYPQLKRRPEYVWLTTLFELVCLVGQLPLLIASLITGEWLVAALSAFGLITSNIAYAWIVRLTYRRFIWRGLLALPVASLADIALRHYSMWQYEFSEVLWKGRNICLPVMQVIPHLPDISPRDNRHKH